MEVNNKTAPVTGQQDHPGKNRYAGILLPLPVSACCTMPLTGIIPLLFRMAYRENIGFPNE